MGCSSRNCAGPGGLERSPSRIREARFTVSRRVSVVRACSFASPSFLRRSFQRPTIDISISPSAPRYDSYFARPRLHQGGSPRPEASSGFIFRADSGTLPDLGVVMRHGLLILLLLAAQESKPADRVVWTTSRITGSPEPPPPLRAERAFPKL